MGDAAGHERRLMGDAAGVPGIGAGRADDLETGSLDRLLVATLDGLGGPTAKFGCGVVGAGARLSLVNFFFRG
jgi:hypothetical protein